MLLPRPRPRPAPGPFSRLARLWRRFFVRFDPDSIPVCHPLDREQLEMLERQKTPGYFEGLAWDRQLVTECLQHYNSMHSGDEYEPAPGKVSQHPHFHNGICWTHGNFVARKKRSGCFSFLPAPRTLFFFELAYRNGFNGVVTCTALDEPVTEAYSVLGFPLWCSARRTGIFDFVCKTCYCRFDVPRPGMQKMFACGHNNVGKVCEMCYRRSHVLHPYPGEFAFGYHDPYHPYSAEC
ncbi:uncharacterized protein LOC8055042 [Sorghum bicolor]|uniref:DUF3615 domain-containing protein n=1 Tax=Sorghum bicolor TaxID=4558 RepID=A0A194YMB6_SORBI|nr:uncharacterized protein LOC8055042 [Sorghum bicolor]KXG29331.1 hypothetical protein SORBI_3004G020200 [Sorghum bicolor]|eukprot:XP_002451424.2 uncharacterized protein LOC8055042 [Sorghum bicolor]